MKLKCEVTRISTPEYTLEQILGEFAEMMAQPVGIVLFGADCDLKDEVYMRCVEQIPNLATGYGRTVDVRKVEQPLSEGRSVLVLMDGETSGNHTRRHQIVMDLRDLGAQAIVGIYARFHPLMRTPEVMMQGGTKEDKQAWVLLNHPPTKDGLDCFVVVEEEKEGHCGK